MRKYFSSLWFLGIVTLTGFPLLAWPIIYLSDKDYTDIFLIKTRDLYTVPTFLSAGILFGLLVIWMTELPYFENALSKYKSLLSNFKINRFYAVFLSFCAGFGEEVFFRGAVQPLLGIWITAVLFVGIHGYFSFKNGKVNVFAGALVFFIALLGWACQEYSIWHAVAGHFSYDLVLLMYYRRTNS